VFTASSYLEVHVPDHAIDASAAKLWHALVRKAEDPVGVVPGATACRILSRDDDSGFVREVLINGETIRERVTLIAPVQVKFTRLDSPGNEGWIENGISRSDGRLCLVFTAAVNLPAASVGSLEEAETGQAFVDAYTRAMTAVRDEVQRSSRAENKTALYPQPTIATEHADPGTVRLLRRYYEAKNRQAVGDTMACFSLELSAYTDATLGWKIAGFEAEKALYSEYMPRWGEGRSYPTRIIGGPRGAIVAMTDTPELFGGEIHALGCVDICDGKITRWVDYWDSAGFDKETFEKYAVPDDKYPSSFGERPGENAADPVMVEACHSLHRCLQGEADLAKLFAYDAVYENMALRALFVGRSAIERYVGRINRLAPFAAGSTVRHIVGSSLGGGYEWSASPAHGPRAGIIALELNDAGLISRVTMAYDSGRLASEAKSNLLALSAD